jgi:hypothetical protein
MPDAGRKMMTDPLGISRRQALKYSGLAAAVPLLPAARRDVSKSLLSFRPQHPTQPQYPIIEDYFFSGSQYIRVTRGDTGPGSVDAGYPAPISRWGWPNGFGANGIDGALYSNTKCYFFSGSQYIRVTRGETGPGSVDAGYPAPISRWGWPNGFGANGIDAALYSVTKDYFFSGNQYIRVTRGDTGPGSVDAGYPAPISRWGWPNGFGANGIDAALYSGSKCYFFSGNQYIRVTRGDTGPGSVDAGYPAPISNWGWPNGFGANGINAALYSPGMTSISFADNPNVSGLNGQTALVMRESGAYSFSGSWSPSNVFTGLIAQNVNFVYTVVDVRGVAWVFSTSGTVPIEGTYPFNYNAAYSGLTENWQFLQAGYSSKWQVNAGLDLGATWTEIVNWYNQNKTTINGVVQVVGSIAGAVFG